MSSLEPALGRKPSEAAEGLAFRLLREPGAVIGG
jgi:hypothetical protein